MESIEKDLNEVKNTVEFVHAEEQDLKKENEKAKKTEREVQQRLEKLEQINPALNHRVIDFQARSMRDNLIFYNIAEKTE
jgi:uncharacterized protein (DUF3084 family)